MDADAGPRALVAHHLLSCSHHHINTHALDLMSNTKERRGGDPPKDASVVPGISVTTLHANPPRKDRWGRARLGLSSPATAEATAEDDASTMEKSSYGAIRTYQREERPHLAAFDLHSGLGDDGGGE
ncbi:hypothetical protein MUK42_17925 [Musa troglodytarum]|uniref:Uncharacterized protein n=1 Tax=Musa troglodytarum TaxID=320322 RepID=A0A9E7HM71_9LILI|nr:hypothetical protein MUK42_17925 [Musa troglodytarum]